MNVEGISCEGLESIYPGSDKYEDHEPSSGSWNGRLVTTENAPNSDLADRVDFCGERCNGEATLHAMVDTDDNKNIDANIKVESESGRVSGSVSGSISQDQDGNTTGKVEASSTIKF